jgi:CRISPR-associated endonuclease/helicase Cas3
MDKLANKKVLIIVNTIKKAQEIYQELKEQGVEDLHLLHSRFTRKDRMIKEDQIQELGKIDKNETGVWVTTQIVEASLDIDFDLLLTELSEVCGLFQRMGRVYRNRNLENEAVNVYVFTGDPTPSGIRRSDKSVVDFDIFTQSKIHLEAFKHGILSEEMKMELVEKVYSVEALKKSNYYNKIRDTINHTNSFQAFEVKKRDIELRSIDTEMIIPHSVYRDNEEEILCNLERLKQSESWVEKIAALNEIKNFFVPMPGYALKIAQKKSLIENQLQISRYEKVYVVSFKYDSDEGLVFKEDQESTFY